MTPAPRKAPPLEVLRHAFEGIAEEMGKTLHRSAYTVVIKDLNDYSCALFDATGALVAQGNNMPTHLGSMSYALKDLIEFWDDDIHPGDVFISNDPYHGGTHLPDVHIFMPVFDGERRFAWAGNIAHHGDWGGRVPGSISVENRSVYEEGVIYPHVRLESRGRPNRDVYALIAANIRQPALGLGDLRAQVASAKTAVERTRALLERYPVDVLEDGMGALIESAETRARRQIAALPDGTYRAEGFLDGNGLPDTEPLPIAVELTIAGSDVIVDLAGTAPQQETAINVPVATTRSAAMFALRTLLDPSIPSNEGCYRPLLVKLPAASLVNPAKPAPVSDRHLTSQRLADVLLRAFAQLDESLATAGWFVGAAWFSCFPPSQKTGEPTMLLLNLCGGAGAAAGHDGLPAANPHLANSTLIPAEIVESDYPLRVEMYQLRAGSGGAGRYRGGAGLRAEFTNISGETFRVQTGMEQTAPGSGAWGLEGGGQGEPGFVAIRDARRGTEQRVDPRAAHQLEAGHTLVICTGGGGGVGAPWLSPIAPTGSRSDNEGNSDADTE
jgi:N-methylhydantoinase B